MKRHLATLATAVALTVVAAAAWAYWSAGSVPGGNGAAAATSVAQGATPTASASGASVTVTWAARTLASGQAVSGYVVKRYDAGTAAAQTILSACTGTVAATSCVENNVPNGSWKYTVTPVFATNWQGLESAKSATVTVNNDATPPTNAITLSSVTGGAFLTGTAVYYRGVAAGSLRLTNAVADAGSGPASSTTAALGGTTTGWTHAPSTVSTPAGGPYVSAAFGWAAGTTSAPTEAVTGRDVAGNTAVTTLSFTNDSTAPTAGTISYADGFAAGRSASVSFTTGTDGGSGIATRQLQRASASVSGSTCGSFSSFVNLGSDGPASPYADATLPAGCYKYRYVVTDRVGNQDVATSANVVKVGYAGAVGATPGLLSHWRLGDTATAAPIASDTFTDTAGKLLTAHTGDLAATWVRQSGTADATISDQGRIYRASGLGGFTINTASKTPVNADYSVEADLVLRSRVNTDVVGVVGRLTSSGTYYAATWQESDNSWNLLRYPVPFLGSSVLASVTGQPDLTAGQPYRLKLDMVGSTLRLYVDGVLKVSATDSSITAPGLAGILDGDSITSPTKNNTTGIHLDSFQVSTAYRALDSKGTNHGEYVNGVTRGVAGAIAGSPDTAAAFDGVNDYVQMLNTTGFPTGAAVRSTEAWFKTSSSARQVLFRYGSGASTQEYGLWIDGGGATMTAWGWGSGNDKVFTMPSPVNNGAWHHVVQTYDGTSLRIYIDGVALAAQAATRSTAMDIYGFGIGAVIRPGDGNSGGYFNGSIDEVSFYTTVLSQATVTDHYQLGQAPAVDGAGPTGGSVDATGLGGTGGRYATSTTLSLALAKGTDPSGVAASGHQVLRATAALAGGTCGSFGPYSPVGTDPTSPFADTVADQACYSYQYVVSDTLGNATTYTSPDIKVDTTAPAAPTLAFSAFSNTWWPGSGSTVYYRSTATPGAVTVTASATDAASAVATYAFPALGTNWTSTPGSLGVTTYSWAGAPAAPGTKNVTATNNAGLVSANAPFTLTADDTAPTAGTVTYASATQTSTSVSVSFTTGTDAASGIGSRLLQRAAAPLTGSTCGTYGSFATVSGGTNPSSPFTDTVTSGSCYKYEYVVSDNVGNSHTATSANVVKVTVSCGSELIGNGGFENGSTTAPWTASPTNVVTNTGTVPARTGSWKALLGGQGTTATETVAQTVTIPSGCSALLSYYLRVTTVETSGPYDYFRVRVGSTTLQTFTDRDLGGSYVQRTVDLSAYAGQTITLTFLSEEDVSLQTSFWLDDVSLTIGAPASYTDTVSGTSGLVNYYRLGESVVSSDSMAGAAGATLQSRNGETAASWTKFGFSDSNAVITDAGRIRKESANTAGALYYASADPSSADYTVEADVFVRSTDVAGDMAGVVGRMVTGNANGTYYLARYELTQQKWVLYRRVNGSWDWLDASTTQALTANTTYRLALDMKGTTIRVLVDGVQQVSASDSAITGPGKAGISLGFASGTTTVSNTTGLHLDNFRVSPHAADSKGTNHGTYLGGVTLGTAGAVAGDADTAATFDGSNDFATVNRQISDDFSIEFWFKSAQGIGTGTQWWSGAGLVDGEVAGAANDFGVSLRSDGRVVAGIGSPDVSVVSTNGGYNNGAWHHVVFTRTQATGALALYVDGASAGTATGASTASLTAPAYLNFGRIQTGLNYLVGSLDEVGIYGAVLSAATVSAHYAAGQ